MPPCLPWGAQVSPLHDPPVCLDVLDSLDASAGHEGIWHANRRCIPVQAVLVEEPSSEEDEVIDYEVDADMASRCADVVAPSGVVGMQCISTIGPGINTGLAAATSCLCQTLNTQVTLPHDCLLATGIGSAPSHYCRDTLNTAAITCLRL